MRPTREKYFMEIAKLVATRSTCERAQVGAVLVNKGRIVSAGYNGSPQGGKHCTDVGCLIYEGHCIRTLHAEVNAVLHLEHKYDYLELYCTHNVCHNCLKMLVPANVANIYYLNEYDCKERDLIIKDLSPSKVPYIRKVKLDEKN